MTERRYKGVDRVTLANPKPPQHEIRYCTFCPENIAWYEIWIKSEKFFICKDCTKESVYHHDSLGEFIINKKGG